MVPLIPKSLVNLQFEDSEKSGAVSLSVPSVPASLLECQISHTAGAEAALFHRGGLRLPV